MFNLFNHLNYEMVDIISVNENIILVQDHLKLKQLKTYIFFWKMC